MMTEPPCPAPPADPECPDPAPAATQRLARIVLAAMFVALGLMVLENFLHALVWAAVLAVATTPLYRRVRRYMPADRHNILLPGLFTLGTTLVVVVPVTLLGFQAAREARTVAVLLGEAQTNGIPLPEVLAHLPVFQDRVASWWAAHLAQPDDVREWLGRMDTEVLDAARAMGGRAARGVVSFTFTLVTLFFLYREGDEVADQMRRASRRLFGPHGEAVAGQVIASIHGTVNGLVLVGLAVGIILGVGYEIAGVPHPALLASATAVGAMFPLGATVVLAVACVLLAVQGQMVAVAVLGGIGVAIIFIADHFVRPALIGGATKLPFLWVLLGILGGVETFGILGLFLGPAIMASLILLWREWVGNAKTMPTA